MPEKLESCVKQVMKEQGISKERAFAICTASLKAADSGIVFDESGIFKSFIDDATGFLTAPVVLARVGVQYYRGYELGLQDRLMEKIGVLRSAEEVFHPDSIKSFVNLIVTDDHPDSLVTIDNVKSLQKGQVSEVVKNSGTLSGVVTVTDRKQIEEIQNGKIEVSVGYSNELKDEKGIFEGKQYEFVQTNIRANHLAIVDAGRCGPACKLTLDNKSKERSMVITIDGIQYTVEDSQLAQAVQNMQSAHDAETEKLKEKLTKEEEEKLKLKKEKDKAEAEKDALEKEKMSDSDLASLVSERAELLTQAKSILGDKMPDCADCPQGIKTLVIDHVLPGMELEGKSEEYINAAYDMAIKKQGKADDSLKKLEGDFIKDKDGNKVTRDSAREKYMNEQLGLET